MQTQYIHRLTSEENILLKACLNACLLSKELTAEAVRENIERLLSKLTHPEIKMK